VQWVRARDKASRVLALPNQLPKLIDRYGLSRADVDREVWAVAPGGYKWGGAAAINRVLEELGGMWAWVAAVYHQALVRRLEDRAYQWIAKHRSWLSRVWGAPPEWKG